MSLTQSPLDDEHRALDANLVEFGGWEMPIAYPSGTIDEHLACRDAAAMFDVSHLGTVRVAGPDAFDRLQRSLTNDLNKISPGRAQYTHLLDPDDASVLDDIIVWWHPARRRPDVFDVMPNASNTDDVASGRSAAIETTHERAVIAVQGPDGSRRCSSPCSPRPAPSVASGSRRATGTACRAPWPARATPASPVSKSLSQPRPPPHLWRALVDAGVTPAGLGARDTLRLEAALPLHGHELGPGITSLQAGLGWVVAWDKPEFTVGTPRSPSATRGITRRSSESPPRADDRLAPAATS